MRPSIGLYSRGFFGRSLEEFKRLSKIAINSEGLSLPTTPRHLIDFTYPNTIQDCKVMSDQDIGGFSRVNLDFTPQTDAEPAHAHFHGSISIELPLNNAQVQRTGFAGWRNKDKPATIFGKSLWDIDPYAYLGLRVKSDGRKYFVNVQTESIVSTDLHQHRLYARRPGEWETVLINWNDFVRTNHGVVVEPQQEMLRQKVRSIGISLIDRVPGPYSLRVSRVWATNNMPHEKDDLAEDSDDKRR